MHSTDEIDDETAIGAASGGATEVGFAVGRQAEVGRLNRGTLWDMKAIASVGDRVAEAEDGGVAS